MTVRKFEIVSGPAVSEVFEEFLLAKAVSGVSPATITAYRNHFHAVSKWIRFDVPVEDLTSEQVRDAVADMADSDLSRTTIRSYTATLASFFHWMRQEGICDVKIALFKAEETVPETYSQAELERLLKRPKNGSDYGEWRAWTIVNLLVNNGLRAGTVRSILVRDVDLDNSLIQLRHTKNRKSQAVPISPELAAVLRRWLSIRKGGPDDYLFQSIDGHQMSATCLRSAIRRFNWSRGVRDYSLHRFRHTFARMYLVDCHGNALKLQRLLGHTTLDMTKHYVKIFDTDLVDDFKDSSPLRAIHAN